MPDTIRQPSLKDLMLSLASVSTARLRQMRTELEDEITSNEFYNSTSEVGRSSTQELLSDPYLKLRAVFMLLAKRGKLTQEEIDDFVNSQPKTFKQVWFLPRIPYGYY